MINKVTPYSSSVYTNNSNVVFGSASKLVRAANKAEIKELVDMFYSTSYKKPNQKSNFITRFIDNIHAKLSKKVRFSQAQTEEFVTTVVKSPNNEIMGGYSIYLDKDRSLACVDFVTLSPKIKSTKEKIKTLFEMGKNISEEAKKHNFIEVAWFDSKSCKTLSKLLKQLNPSNVDEGLFLSKEKSLYVRDLNTRLERVANKYKVDTRG